MKPKRCTSLWPFTGPIPSGNRRRCTLEAGHTGNHTIIPPSGMDYAPDDEPGIEPPEPEETIQELRDQKMALLLIADDCHRIMSERADEVDSLQIRLREMRDHRDRWYSAEVDSLQIRLREMRDHRDRWYAAAGQRQDELNEAHRAIRQIARIVRATKTEEPREALWTLLKETEQWASQNHAARVALAGEEPTQ